MCSVNAVLAGTPGKRFLAGFDLLDTARRKVL